MLNARPSRVKLRLHEWNRLRGFTVRVLFIQTDKQTNKLGAGEHNHISSPSGHRRGLEGRIEPDDRPELDAAVSCHAGGISKKVGGKGGQGGRQAQDE